MNQSSAAAAENLAPAEEQLLAAILAGRRADLQGETIRASFLRDLVTEVHPTWVLPPIGILLDNAMIQGTLDLEGCTVARPLVFQHCKFRPIEPARGAIQLRDAQLKRLALYKCSATGSIFADRANIDSALFLSGSSIEGAIRLRGATIGEALAMDSMQIKNAGDIAVLADGLRLSGPWILRESDIVGEVRLAGARIGGNLLWEDAKIQNNLVAVTADGAICEGAWLLRRTKISGPFRLRGMKIKAIDAQQIAITAGSEAINARGAEIASDLNLDGAVLKGGILLGRANIAGELSAKGAQISGAGQDWAIAANGLIVGQGIALAAAKLHGGLMLSGARINQGISASNIEIDGKGRAIEADVIHIGGNWIMRGAKIVGSIRFAGAQIEGQIGFTEIDLQSIGDLAIRADGAMIRGGWFMGRASIRGLVRLPSAHLGNEMRLRATKIEVAAGPALFASGVTIARELVLDGGFSSSGGVVLDRADIQGTLDLTGSRLQSAELARGSIMAPKAHDDVITGRYDAIAISLVDARLDRIVMPDTAPERPRGIVDLSRAHVGSYDDAAEAWPPPLYAKRGIVRGRSADGRDIDHLILDGFVYDHLETPTGIPASSNQRHRRSNAAVMRTRWLEAQSADDLEQHFKPQSWVHLSRRLSAQGYQDDAREIAISRRRRQRKSASVSRSAKLQGWFLDVFALYGFNPWRTVIWMAAFVTLFAAIWWWAALGCARADCKDEEVYVMALKGNYGQDDMKSEQKYPGFVPFAYSLDVFLPFVNLGYKEHWRPRTAYQPIAAIPLPAASWHGRQTLQMTLGGMLYAMYVLEMLLGLVLASLAVTGFAGMLKGDDEAR